MHEFIVSKSSWHYRIARLFNSEYHIRYMNFCQYWRHLIFGSIIITVLSAGALFLISMFLYGLYWMIADPSSEVAMLMYILFFILFIGFSIFMIIVAIEKLFGRGYLKVSENNIIKVKYRSWKEKYCPMIRIEE